MEWLHVASVGLCEAGSGCTWQVEGDVKPEVAARSKWRVT